MKFGSISAVHLCSYASTPPRQEIQTQYHDEGDNRSGSNTAGHIHRAFWPDVVSWTRRLTGVDDPEGVVRSDFREGARLDVCFHGARHGILQLDAGGCSQLVRQQSDAGVRFGYRALAHELVDFPDHVIGPP